MRLYRITFLSGLAAGFILGARAGRERYEQIKRAGRRMADSPAAQQAAGAVQAQAAGLARAAKQKVTDEFHDRMPKLAGTARDKMGDHMPGLRHRNGNGNSRPAGSAQASGDGSFTATRRPPGSAG
jgi:hypothetical protein